MRSMFDACSSLEAIDVSGWDTSKVTDMGYLFSSCRALKELDLSSWDVCNVGDAYAMISGYGLEEIRTPRNISASVSVDLPGKLYGSGRGRQL